MLSCCFFCTLPKKNSDTLHVRIMCGVPVQLSHEFQCPKMLDHASFLRPTRPRALRQAQVHLLCKQCGHGFVKWQLFSPSCPQIRCILYHSSESLELILECALCGRLLCLWQFSVCCSILDAFMKSFQTRRTTWATDWPVIRMTTRSPTPPPSTLPSRFCPSTLTTRNQPQRRAAAAPPPPQKTPTLLRHTPQPSLNTPRCKACPPHRQEWRRTLFPKSSTSELWNKTSRLKPIWTRNLSSEVDAELWTTRPPLCTMDGSAGQWGQCSNCFWNFPKVNPFKLKVIWLWLKFFF